MQLAAIGTGRAPAPLSDWSQFIPNESWSSPPPDAINARPRRPIEAVLPRDRSAVWLRNAAIGLCALAAAAAAVSFTAQYRMVYADRRLAVIAGLKAAIPDTAALIFACLGVALALHGHRALRARALNVDASGDLRAGQRHADRRSAELGDRPAQAPERDACRRGSHPLAVVGGLVLWLSLAPASMFLALVTERHGLLAAISLDKVAKIAAALAPQVELNTGAARTVLRGAVLATDSRNGDPRYHQVRRSPSARWCSRSAHSPR